MWGAIRDLWDEYRKPDQEVPFKTRAQNKVLDDILIYSNEDTTKYIHAAMKSIEKSHTHNSEQLLYLNAILDNVIQKGVTKVSYPNAIMIAVANVFATMVQKLPKDDPERPLFLEIIRIVGLVDNLSLNEVETIKRKEQKLDRIIHAIHPDDAKKREELKVALENLGETPLSPAETRQLLVEGNPHLALLKEEEKKAADAFSDNYEKQAGFPSEAYMNEAQKAIYHEGLKLKEQRDVLRDSIEHYTEDVVNLANSINSSLPGKIERKEHILTEIAAGNSQKRIKLEQLLNERDILNNKLNSTTPGDSQYSKIQDELNVNRASLLENIGDEKKLNKLVVANDQLRAKMNDKMNDVAKTIIDQLVPDVSKVLPGSSAIAKGDKLWKARTGQTLPEALGIGTISDLLKDNLLSLYQTSLEKETNKAKLSNELVSFSDGLIDGVMNNLGRFVSPDGISKGIVDSLKAGIIEKNKTLPIGEQLNPDMYEDLEPMIKEALEGIVNPNPDEQTVKLLKFVRGMVEGVVYKIMLDAPSLEEITRILSRMPSNLTDDEKNSFVMREVLKINSPADLGPKGIPTAMQEAVYGILKAQVGSLTELISPSVLLKYIQRAQAQEVKGQPVSQFMADQLGHYVVEKVVSGFRDAEKLTDFVGTTASNVLTGLAAKQTPDQNTPNIAKAETLKPMVGALMSAVAAGSNETVKKGAENLVANLIQTQLVEQIGTSEILPDATVAKLFDLTGSYFEILNNKALSESERDKALQNLYKTKTPELLKMIFPKGIESLKEIVPDAVNFFEDKVKNEQLRNQIWMFLQNEVGPSFLPMIMKTLVENLQIKQTIVNGMTQVNDAIAQLKNNPKWEPVLPAEIKKEEKEAIRALGKAALQMSGMQGVLPLAITTDKKALESHSEKLALVMGLAIRSECQDFTQRAMEGWMDNIANNRDLRNFMGQTISFGATAFFTNMKVNAEEAWTKASKEHHYGEATKAAFKSAAASVLNFFLAGFVRFLFRPGPGLIKAISFGITRSIFNNPMRKKRLVQLLSNNFVDMIRNRLVKPPPPVPMGTQAA